jgi:trk system potassium uptake protein TrkH
MTTTGFATVEMVNLSTPIILILVILMSFGGAVGSTAGGIKQYRIYILLKDFIWNIKGRISNKYIIRPNTVDKFGESVKVEDEEKLAIGNFALLYLMILIIGTFVITCYGYPLADSLLEFSSALSSAGLSSGIISVTAPAGVLITCILGMFLGRLEMYIVFIAIAKLCDDVKNKVIG